MMKYLDFIESFELGENQRYDNEFEAALGTLGMAKALLDEIISERNPPNSGRPSPPNTSGSSPASPGSIPR